MSGFSSPSKRRARAVESFGSAAAAIGPIELGTSVFCVTRGQWSMIDAVLHTLDCVGPSRISLWTWTVAEYEIQVLTRLQDDWRLSGGTLIIDAGARTKNKALLAAWHERFGAGSVRYVVNHAKIATVESASGYKVLIRGSMNLNFNPRFEQCDVTEGGPDYELVKRIESDLPILEHTCSGAQAWAASGVGDAFTAAELSAFRGVKVWAK